jgi:hypothetical protein
MRIVGVGVDEADGDGLDALRNERRSRLAHRGLIQRRDNAAIGRNALHRLKPPPPRHQRLGLAPGHIEHTGRADPADLQHVAETARGQQSGSRTDLLQDGVGRHRGAVHHLGDFARIEPRLRQHCRDANCHALTRISRRGCRLVHMDAPIGQRQHDVREGASDIHADARSTAHVHSPKLRMFACTAVPSRRQDREVIATASAPNSGGGIVSAQATTLIGAEPASKEWRG